MWYFPHPETAIPLEEPADPRGSRSYRRIVDSGWEKCATFFEKRPEFSLNSTRFLGSKVALSSRKNPLNFFGVPIFLHSGLFRKRKLPLSTPKNESNLTKIGIFLRKCGFFLIRRLQFSLWSGYLGDISQLVYKNYILGFRQMPHFLTKIPVSFV